MPMTKPTSEQVTFLAAGTGASQRTALDKLRDVVSVKDFGAVGDGVADDTAAINSAIAATVGKALFFPSGTYMTTGGHVLTNQYAFGSSRNSSIIKKLSGGSNIILLSNTSTEAASISDLTIDGNSLNGHGIFVANTQTGTAASTPSFITRMLIKNIGAAVTTVNVSGITAANPGVVTTAAAHGLVIGDVVRVKSVQGIDTTALAFVEWLDAGSGYTPGTHSLTLTYVSGQTATTYGIADIVVGGGGTVTSVTLTTQPTGYTTRNRTTVTAAVPGGGSGFQCSLIPYGSPARSLFNRTGQVGTVPSITQFSLNLNSTGFSAYVSGGTVEKCSYALCLGALDPTGAGKTIQSKTVTDIVFESNYGDIFTENAAYCMFENLTMYGNRTGYGIYAGTSTNRCTWDEVYMESGIGIVAGFGVRHLTFQQFDVVLSASNTWSAPWLESIGFNSTLNIGGENAGLVVDGVRLNRQQAGVSAIPLVWTNSYQAAISRVNIVEQGTTGATEWGFIRDDGMKDAIITEVTGESTSTVWDLFDQQSIGGFVQKISRCGWTQGYVGKMTLSGTNPPATTLAITQVDNCAANISVRKNDGLRSFYVYNIIGDVDMTNASAIGSIVNGVVGTVTNPGATSAAKPITLAVYAGSLPLVINPAYAYADNAAAIAAGRVVGEVYRRTSDSALMVVS